MPPSTSRSCTTCGWPYPDVRICCADGVPTGGDPRDVRLRHDLAAALRASIVATGALAVGVPPAVEHCRDWADLTAADLDRRLAIARQALAADLDPGAATAEIAEPVRSGIARVVAGLVGRLLLLQVAADGVTWCAVSADEQGEAVVVDGPPPLDVWTDLLPPGAAGNRRLYLLAGGIEAVTPAAGTASAAQQAAAVAAAAELDRPDTEYLLLGGDSTLWLADVLAAVLRDIVPPAAVLRVGSPTTPAELACKWVAGAPLRRGYGLVHTTVEETTGLVRPLLHPLFPAGAEPGWHVPHRVTLTIDAFDGRPGEVLLPVVVGSAGTVPADALLVDAPVVELNGPESVWIELEGPGRVVVAGGRVSRPPVTGRRWDAGYRDRAPRHLDHDIAVAVEVAGPAAVVTRRLDVLRNLVQALELRERAMPGNLRVAALQYWDHGPGPAVDATPLLTPEALLAKVGLWRPVKWREKWGTALEDALQEACGLEWARARRTLVVIGSRPPAVVAVNAAKAILCPHEINWKRQVERLHRLGIRILAVHDEPRWTEPGAPFDRTRRAWVHLGSGQEPRSLDTYDLPSLVEAIVPGSIAPVRLCRLMNGA